MCFGHQRFELYSLHEQGWETRLGTLKVSDLYHKKVKFPLRLQIELGGGKLGFEISWE